MLGRVLEYSTVVTDERGNPVPSLHCSALPSSGGEQADKDAVRACLAAWGMRLPVVGKPPAGRGSEGVKLLRTEADVAKHCRTLAAAALDTDPESESRPGPGSRYGEGMILERLLEGQEATLAVMPPGRYLLPWAPQWNACSEQRIGIGIESGGAGRQGPQAIDLGLRGSRLRLESEPAPKPAPSQTHARPQVTSHAPPASASGHWWMHPNVRLYDSVHPIAVLSPEAVSRAGDAVRDSESPEEGMQRMLAALQCDASFEREDWQQIRLWGGHSSALDVLLAFFRGTQEDWWPGNTSQGTSGQGTQGPGLALCDIDRYWCLPPILRGGPAVGLQQGGSCTGGQLDPYPQESGQGTHESEASLMPYNGAVPVVANSRALTSAEAEACLAPEPGNTKAGDEEHSLGGALGMTMHRCELVATLAQAKAPIRIDCRAPRAGRQCYDGRNEDEDAGEDAPSGGRCGDGSDSSETTNQTGSTEAVAVPGNKIL